MTISADQLKNVHGQSLGDWSQVGKMEIRPKAGFDITKVIFANFSWKTQ